MKPNLKPIRFAALHLLVLVHLSVLLPSSTAAAETDRLTVCHLPVIDALPLYVAQDSGLFAANQITVEMVLAASALERDQLMQAGRIDGGITDLIGSILFNRDGPRVRVVGTVLEARPESPVFRLLASPGSRIQSVADLGGVPIAVSKHTIIEYFVDRLRERSRIVPENYLKTSVPSVPERFQLLIQNRVAAAALPDPLAASAVAAGARQIADVSMYPPGVLTVWSFSVQTVTARPSAIRKFMAAWCRAVEKINADPAAFRPILVDKVRLPDNIQTTYPVPPFAGNRIPEQTQWDDVVAWMTTRQLITATVSYRQSVTSAFLPVK